MTASSEFRISKRLVVINSASSVVTHFLNITVLLWAYQYLIRRIPAEEFAIYPVVTSLMVIAPLFFLTFSGGISRYVVDAYVRGDTDGVAEIGSSIIPFVALAAGFFLIIGLTVATHVDYFLNIPETMTSEAELMLSLLVAGFSVRMLFVPFEAGFHARQRFVELNLLILGQDILKMLILVALLVGVGPRVLWIVVATVISEFVFTVIKFVRARQLLPSLSLSFSRFDPARARSLMSFGGWTLLGHLSMLMQVHAAVIILNLFSTAVNVTAFYIGSTLHNQINRTVQSGLGPLQPVLTAMHATNDDKSLANTAMRGGRYACWIVMAIAAPLAIYAQEFVLLYVGPTYLSAAWVIVLFMGVQMVSRPTALMGMTVIAKNKVRAYYLGNFVIMFCAVATVVSAVHFGGGAVAATTALSLVIILGYAVFFWPFFLRMIDKSAGEFLRHVLIPGLAPTFAGSAVWLPLKATVSIDNWSTFLVCTTSGGVAYVLTLSMACLMPGDRADMRAIFTRVRSPS